MLFVIANGCRTDNPLTATEAHFVPVSYFGLHIHNADKAENWPVFQFNAWRLWDAYVSWPHIQPTKNQWNFAKLDGFVERAQLEGISLLLPLGLSPTWASARPEESSAYKRLGWAAEPSNIEYWKRYVEKTMRRYKGKITYYEIWNEPNLKRFFSGSVKSMVDLTCTAKQIAWSVDPKIKIVSPGATRMNSGVSWLNTFFEYGGADCIDIVGFHFYVNAHDEPEKMVKYAQMVRKVMKNFNVGSKPLWNTETGWYFAHAEGGPHIRYRVLSLDNSASYLMRAFILGAGLGFERFFWFSWNSRKMGGLIEPNSKKPKKAAYAFATIRRWLSGSVISPCKEHSRIWTCAIEFPDKQHGIIAWVTKGTSQLSARKWGVDTVISFDGRDSVRSILPSLDSLILLTNTPQIFLKVAK